MKSWVQVLTTPTADTAGTTLLLHFDNKRYLIGSLAEGTQRASIQMGARLLKVQECFLTGRTEWRNTGGLIGMILTLADSAASSRESSMQEALARAKAKGKRLGVLEDTEKMKELEDEAVKSISNNTLSVFAPPNLNHTLATARRFVFRKGMPVNVHEIKDDALGEEGDDEWAPYWADENIKVWAMSIAPDSNSRTASADANGITRPRKRSIAEVYGRESPTDKRTADELTPVERDQLTVKAVVSEMFDSSWRLDTLYKTPLCEVKLPASIFIRDETTGKVRKYDGPLPGGEQPVPDPQLEVLVRRPWPGALVESLPHTEPAKEAISYIIRNHTQRGKFSPERAIELKVSQRPKWSQLTSGSSVENDDGETITPDMVLGQSKEGGGLAVVDLPDASYIDSLISRPEWREPKVMAGVAAIVWSCGRDVASDSRILEFMNEFSHLKHIISSQEHCPNNISLDSVTAATVRLRAIDNRRYGIPVHDNDCALPMFSPSMQVARRGQIFELEPAFKIRQDQVVPPISISEKENELSPDVIAEAKSAQQTVENEYTQGEQWAANILDKDAEVITLGTGSALPSKYRNVSATLVRIPSYGNILLDCGENTLGQLRRVFSAEELKQIFRDLKVLFISHMHADHHLGTVSVIKAWYEEVHRAQSAPLPPTDSHVQSRFTDQQRLAVIAEPAMLHWLHEYSSIEDYGFSRIAPLYVSAAGGRRDEPSKLGWFIPPMEFTGLSPGETNALYKKHVVPPSLIGVKDIQAVLVQHCHGARAVSITLPSGFKLSYSGDCRPSKAFAKIGRGTTVCIHEATFDDELQGDAEAKNHSTTSEALTIAQAMGAKACVLTHFSQRYQKLPVLEHGQTNGAATEDEAMKEELLAETDDAVEAEDESTNPEDAMNGPLEDVAATFPDQKTSNGIAGKQYELPSKKRSNSAHKTKDSGRRDGSTSGTPAAVKFKLASDMKVAVAFDYMRVKVGEIWQMEKFVPALLKLFAEEEDKAERERLQLADEREKKGRKGKGR